MKENRNRQYDYSAIAKQVETVRENDWVKMHRLPMAQQKTKRCRPKKTWTEVVEKACQTRQLKD